jgi:hypothetical protein
MEIKIKFTNDSARRTEYYLRRRYKSKANLEKLAKVAILTEAANEAKIELSEVKP